MYSKINYFFDKWDFADYFTSPRGLKSIWYARTLRRSFRDKYYEE